MKKILYYITDHGKGHATRSVAVIRELQKHNVEIIVRNSSTGFFTRSLPSVNIIPGKTDVGPIIKENGISIDVQKSSKIVGKWIEELDVVAKRECENIKKISPDLIISDVSAMPFLVAKSIDKQSIAISNFSWYDVGSYLSKSQSEFLRECYDVADLTVQLPMGTQMNHFRNKKKVGLVCRKQTKSRKQIRKELKINDSEYCIFSTIGSEKILNSKINSNVKIISTSNFVIKNQNVINISDWTEGQDLVNASDLIICKCGYGMISECLSTGKPFLYVADENHLEQKAIMNYLTKSKKGTNVSIDSLSNIEFNRDYLSKFISYEKEENDTKSAANIVLEFLNR